MFAPSRSLLFWSSIFVAISSFFFYIFLTSRCSHHVTEVNSATRPSKYDSPSDVTESPQLQPSKPAESTAQPVPTLTYQDGDWISKVKSRELSAIVPLSSSIKPLTVADIDDFNNKRLTPLLKSICSMDYFRFVKLNLKKPCTLWADDGRCSERDCSIRFCDENDLPFDIMDEDATSRERLPSSTRDKDCTEDGSLADVNETISLEHEETMDSLFECTNDEDGQYIDLSLNPERFTGYRGDSAHRVWKSIYEENCFFRRGGRHHHPHSPVKAFSLENVCYEERIFYRAVSGLHTSINIHLSASYPVSKSMTGGGGERMFTPNVEEFVRRFRGHESFLMNLYFLFLLEMRALQKAEGYLLNQVIWKSSGNSVETRDAIKSLLKVVKGFEWKFNEFSIFQRDDPLVAQEFSAHFKNITSSIMDCVACDKCRLWGKIQMHGLGTAFKILTHQERGGSPTLSSIHLTRHEITSLINAISRLSSSISYLDDFKRLLDKDPKSSTHSTPSLFISPEASKTVPFSSRVPFT